MTADFMDRFFEKRTTTDPRELSRFTVKRDRWDSMDLDAVMEEMSKLNAARLKLCDFVKATGNGMTSDTFFSLFKHAPQSEDPEEIRPDYFVNALVRDELQTLNEWAELRALGTVGNDLNAALGFISLRPTLETIYDRLESEAQQAAQMQAQQEALYDMEGEQSSLEEMLAGLDASDTDESAELQEKLDQLAAQIAAVGQELSDTGDSLQRQLKTKMPGLTTALEEGLRGAIKDAEQQAQIDDLLWGTHRGDMNRLPAAERLKLADKIKDNSKLAQLAALIGPIERCLFAEQRQKIEHAYDEIYDVSKGDDLTHVLLDELVTLHFPKLRRVFYRNFAEQALLQYELRGEERAGLGAIICETDSSGSMRGPKEIWAKAIGVSLMRLAHEQKRDFHGIHFGWKDELWEHPFPGDKDIDTDAFVAYVECFLNSGTDFETPLTRALNILRAQHDEFGFIRGDIVFITDGIAQVGPEWLAEFKAEQERLGFQVFGVLTGTPPASRYLDDLNVICDGRVTNVRSLTDGSDMTTVFGSIRSS